MASDPADEIDGLNRQLASLRKSMRSGVLTVESPDTGRVTYRTYGEMRVAERDLIRDINAFNERYNGRPARVPTHRIVLTSRSGF